MRLDDREAGSKRKPGPRRLCGVDSDRRARRSSVRRGLTITAQPEGSPEAADVRNQGFDLIIFQLVANHLSFRGDGRDQLLSGRGSCWKNERRAIGRKRVADVLEQWIGCTDITKRNSGSGSDGELAAAPGARPRRPSRATGRRARFAGLQVAWRPCWRHRRRLQLVRLPSHSFPRTSRLFPEGGDDTRQAPFLWRHCATLAQPRVLATEPH